MRHRISWTFGISAILALASGLAGCSQPNRSGASKEGAAASKGTAGHDHSAWWCAEHGVPEADCSQCLPDAEVKKRFKDQGDWCAKHRRALSQCFICNPNAREKFAAQYRAKEGKDPPPTEDDVPKPERTKKS